MERTSRHRATQTQPRAGGRPQSSLVADEGSEMVGSGAAKGAAVHERGCLTKRPLPQFAEFRAKTDDVLKIASEAAGEEIVGMPPPLLRLVPEIERAIGKGPDLEPGSPADLNHFADGKQVLVLRRSLVDVAARIKFDSAAKHVICSSCLALGVMPSAAAAAGSAAPLLKASPFSVTEGEVSPGRLLHRLRHY